MPTGLKVVIGRLVVSFLLFALVAVVIGAGGLWLKGQTDGLVEGVQDRAEAQQEASATLERLEREHPFTPPADERVAPESDDRFFEATALAWSEIEPIPMTRHPRPLHPRHPSPPSRPAPASSRTSPAPCAPSAAPG